MSGLSKGGLWLVLLAAMAPAACTTVSQNYAFAVSSWTGSSEASLIREWGVPNRSYDASGSRFLEYSSSNVAVLPGYSPTYTTTFFGNIATTTATGGSPPTAIQLSCTTIFELRGGVVVGSSFSGNNCIAQRPDAEQACEQSVNPEVCTAAFRECLSITPTGGRPFDDCMAAAGFPRRA